MADSLMVRFEGVHRPAALTVVLSLFVACGPDGRSGGPTLPTSPAAFAVSSAAPNPAISGVIVTINGSGFAKPAGTSPSATGPTVTFGGVAAEVLEISSSWIRVRPPELAPGRVDVVVTNPNGESVTLAGGLTVAPFAVTEAFPTRGFGDLTYTIFGTGLIGGTSVRFGGVAPPFASGEFGSIRHGGSRLYGLLPPHAPGPVDITITHPLGRTLTIPNGLTYVPQPVLTAFPGTVPVGGSLTVSWVTEVFGPVDFISLFPEGVAKNAHWEEIAAQHVRSTSGSMTFAAPSSPGRYEFRYLPFEGQWWGMAARSNVVTVTPASPAHTYDIRAILRVGSAQPVRPSR